MTAFDEGDVLAAVFGTECLGAVWAKQATPEAKKMQAMKCFIAKRYSGLFLFGSVTGVSFPPSNGAVSSEILIRALSVSRYSNAWSSELFNFSTCPGFQPDHFLLEF